MEDLEKLGAVFEELVKCCKDVICLRLEHPNFRGKVKAAVVKHRELSDVLKKIFRAQYTEKFELLDKDLHIAVYSLLITTIYGEDKDLEQALKGMVSTVRSLLILAKQVYTTEINPNAGRNSGGARNSGGQTQTQQPPQPQPQQPPQPQHPQPQQLPPVPARPTTNVPPVPLKSSNPLPATPSGSVSEGELSPRARLLAKIQVEQKKLQQEEEALKKASEDFHKADKQKRIEEKKN